MKVKNEHSDLVQWLDRQKWIHFLVKLLCIRELIAWFLGRCPIRRFFPPNTIVEIVGLESFFLCDEIFNRKVYEKALSLSREIKTVIDLGCNAGYFCCYLHHYFNRNDFQGIAIDANPTILKYAKRNLTINHLNSIQLFNGLVGAVGKEMQKFYICPSSLGSSQFPEAEPRMPNKGKWKEIKVPTIDPLEIWNTNYGDLSIDLLKIDIEGSEGNLLCDSPSLFHQSKSIVLEWHKSIVKEEALFPHLRRLGFVHHQVLEKNNSTEIWFFSRQ